MNICIGGCWHGSKLLQNQKSNSFVVKDKNTGEVTVYERFSIWIAEERHTFWVADFLGYTDAKERIMLYLNQME